MLKIFTAICCLFVTTPIVGASESSSPPNILFVFADDWGRYARVYAELDGPGTLNDVVRTPNFDALAKEGVLFRQAFVSAPSCTPCRSALLTGQHFWRTGQGAILTGAAWDASLPSFPLLLKQHGWHIGESGKVWSPGTPVDAPFGAGKYAYDKAGRGFNRFSQNVTKRIESGVDVSVAKQELYDQVRKNFDTFLAKRRPDQPFCYWFGPTNVHRSFVKGSGAQLWGFSEADLKGKLPAFLPDVPEVRADLCDYLGEIAAFDHALGELIDRLAEIGELENTLIVVSGDHGAPGFPHGKCNLYDFGSSVPLAIRWGGTKGGRVIDDLVSLTDLAPTFLELAGVEIPSQMTGKSLVDVLQSDQSGQIDPQRAAVYIGRERHVGDARDDSLPYPQRAIRTKDYLYIVNFEPNRWPMGNPRRLDGDDPPTTQQLQNNTSCTLADEDASPTKAWLVERRRDPKWRQLYDLAYGKRPREELYDLKVDRDEVHNVAADPRYAEIRAHLEKQLFEELRATGDPRLVDHGRYFEAPPLAGPTSKHE